MGAPITKPYKPEYCEMLKAHMGDGYSFTSFGATAKCSKDTLAKWVEENPDFAAAKKEGETLQHKWWENFGRTMAAGQIKRVKSEKAQLDHNGKVVYDKNGEIVMDREYEYTQGAQTIYVWMTKNLLKWTDRQEVTHQGGSKPIEIVQPLSEIPEAQLTERINMFNTLLLEHNATKIQSN